MRAGLARAVIKIDPPLASLRCTYRVRTCIPAARERVIQPRASMDLLYTDNGRKLTSRAGVSYQGQRDENIIFLDLCTLYRTTTGKLSSYSPRSNGCESRIIAKQSIFPPIYVTLHARKLESNQRLKSTSQRHP